MNWNLSYLVNSAEEYNTKLQEANEIVDKLASFKGKLNQEAMFKEYLLTQLTLVEKFLPVYQYAHLKNDLNRKDISNQTDFANARAVFVKLSEATSFADPEVLAIGKETIMKFIDNNPEIHQFKFEFEKLFRRNEHILDENSENLLSYFEQLSQQGESLYSSLAVADGVSHKVKLSTKQIVDVNQSNYRSLITDAASAKDRQKIFEAIFNDFEKNKNTFAGIYESVLLADKAQAKARKYKTILDSYLFNNNIPVSVYTTLVKVASKKTQPLKKYIKLRKQYLGLRQYHTYDRLLELASSNDKYTYEEAKSVFFESISKFPKEFQDKAHQALEDGFVDVNPSDGKRTGAYSSGMPNKHPFILLNYTSTLDDVFTVAHEAGHSIHSLFAASSQPTSLQDYTIFVAEIASTFNEHVLLDYFMKKDDISKDTKIALLQKAIDNIMGTFYRQTLFAEYELEAHKLVENNMPINYEVLSNIMIKLYKKYYGLDIRKEKVKEYVWAYIPHLFYTPFYVYQYATSFAASLKIHKDVTNNVPNAFDRYLGLLKSGGSQYPVDQAATAGVDFTKETTFTAVVERMEQLVDELEKLLVE